MSRVFFNFLKRVENMKKMIFISYVSTRLDKTQGCYILVCIYLLFILLVLYDTTIQNFLITTNLAQKNVTNIS